MYRHLSEQSLRAYNEDHRPQKKLPTREQVREALEARLIDMQQNGPKPDVRCV